MSMLPPSETQACQCSTTLPPSLVTLAPELLLRVIDLLPPQAIARLSATCSTLHAVASSEFVWKQVVQAIRFSDGGESEPGDSHAGESWWTRASFLVPNAQHLGYWVSSTAYTSRIIRLSTSVSSSPPTLTIHACQLVPSNALADPSYVPSTPLALPLGCVLSPTATSYTVPRRGPGAQNPDRGLSVDLLEPSYSFLPLFTITRSSGALLSTTPYSSLSPDQSGQTLKLQLEAVQKEVVRKENGERNEVERRRSEVESMYDLFTGRIPGRPWPTEDLVGVERGEAEGRTTGAFRGLKDWMTARGDEGNILGESRDGAVTSSLSPSPKSFVTGFRLQVRRQIPSLPDSTLLSPAARTSFNEELMNVGDDIPRRRRGVGANGGPAILWNGREGDPDERPGVAVLRVNGGAGALGGFVFTLPTHRTRQESLHDQAFDEEVRTDREEFYPIHAPARPISFMEASYVDGDGEVSAASLEGLWVGTYGSHGLEFGYLSIKLSPMPHPSSPSGTRVYKRQVDFCKVTGDSNVPSGQISWTAVLPFLSLGPSETPSTASLGSIPSVTNQTLLNWSTHDPLNTSRPAYASEEPRWEQGACPGAGRVALSGFVNASWTGAMVTFIRSSVRFTKIKEREDGTGWEEEERIVEAVEEIRVRWAELGKVGIFKRVRV